MTRESPSASHRLAQHLAGRYAAHPSVLAVVLGGSVASGISTADSDIDLYVYSRGPVPLDFRASIPETDGAPPEIGNAFWEPGDEWIDGATGIGVDVMFRDPRWIEEQLDRVLIRHEGSVGYSTCFWHNVATSVVLFDREGWFARLQERARVGYPEPLRRAIVAKNLPLLRHNQSSFRHQLARALSRGDRTSVNHRVAALLASIFDILFAANRLTHPGEKRLVEVLEARAAVLPRGFRGQVEAILEAAGQGSAELLPRVDELVDGVEAVVREAGVE